MLIPLESRRNNSSGPIETRYYNLERTDLVAHNPAMGEVSTRLEICKRKPEAFD